MSAFNHLQTILHQALCVSTGGNCASRRRDNETTEVASRAGYRVGPVRHRRIDGRRARRQRGAGREHEGYGVRNSARPVLPLQPAAPRLRKLEYPRKAVPPIRRTRSPAHLLPEQPETGRNTKEEERERSATFSYAHTHWIARLPRRVGTLPQNWSGARSGTLTRPLYLKK